MSYVRTKIIPLFLAIVFTSAHCYAKHDSNKKSIKTLKIAIATEREFLEKGWREDNVLRIKLISLLRRAGIKDPESSVVIVDWRDKEVALHSFDTIFLSSTWNIVDFPDEFRQWLKDCESDGTSRLINNSDIITKAFDKKNYFEEISSVLSQQKNLNGVITPTYFTDPIRESDENMTNKRVGIAEIRNFLRDSGYTSDEIVVKPRVSADSKDMSRIKISRRADKAIEKELAAALSKVKTSGGMIQPLIKTVEKGSKYGEYQLLFLNGTFSHANAKPSGFGDCLSATREFVKKDDLPEGMYDFAKFIATYYFTKYNVIRIRIDLLVDSKQRPLLLEAEVIDPNSNTDSVYKFSLSQLGKKDGYLPCDECPEYNKVMEGFAMNIYKEAVRLKTKNMGC